VHEADVLLNAEPRDINFRYVLFRKTSLEHAPHLFVNNSPALMFATLFETSFNVQGSLELAGVKFVQSVDEIVARLLRDMEKKRGGTSYEAALDGLQQKMRGRFSGITIDQFMGFDGATSYNAVSKQKWLGV
jgi:hypothetical protein